MLTKEEVKQLKTIAGQIFPEPNQVRNLINRIKRAHRIEDEWRSNHSDMVPVDRVTNLFRDKNYIVVKAPREVTDQEVVDFTVSAKLRVFFLYCSESRGGLWNRKYLHNGEVKINETLSDIFEPIKRTTRLYNFQLDHPYIGHLTEQEQYEYGKRLVMREPMGFLP